jgi:hypothetical protein
MAGDIQRQADLDLRSSAFECERNETRCKRPADAGRFYSPLEVGIHADEFSV